MGIRSPGAMRQWGRHPTAFVGRRHLTLFSSNRYLKNTIKYEIVILGSILNGNDERTRAINYV